jgi:hypothetical protein
MAKDEFKDYICEPFCAFYRPGVKEELACGGALALESLLKDRIISPEILSRMKQVRRTDVRRNKALDLTVCNNCDFIGDGCDFSSFGEQSDAEPCGGYILLDLLMAKGLISIKELEKNNDR